MDNVYEIINKLLVDTFNDVMYIEEQALKIGMFSDVSITEVHTIEAVTMYKKKTMSELAKCLNITVGTLTVAINNLVKKGYVERFKSETDKRVVYVGLTKRGRLLYRVHDKFHKDMVKATIDGLSKQEEDILANALIRLDKFLKEKYAIRKGDK